MYEVRLRKLCACAFLTFATSAQTGEVRLAGQVRDPSGANAANVCVELKPVGSSERVAAILTNDSGEFTFTGLAPRAYDLSLKAFGFKTQSLNINLLQKNNTIPPLVLELSPAEDYDVDSLIAYESRRLRSGNLELHSGCAVNLEEGKVICPTTPATRAVRKSDDFRVETDGQEIYVTALNGAEIAPVPTSAPTQTDACRSLNYSLNWVRIERLRDGGRFCIRTHEGHAAELDLSLETVCIPGDVYLSFVVWKP